jgi:hypothetical protein
MLTNVVVGGKETKIKDVIFNKTNELNKLKQKTMEFMSKFDDKKIFVPSFYTFTYYRFIISLIL